MSKYECEYVKVNTAKIHTPIFIDTPYDEETRLRKQMEKIIKNFNPNLVNPVCVAEVSDGEYELLDGRCTVRVLKTMNNDKDLDIDCKVYLNVPRKDVPELYSLVQGHKDYFYKS